MTLVHYGFSREEVYFMPLCEVLDYVKIIIEDNSKEIEQIKSYNSNQQANNSGSDYSFAGNSLPGM